MFSTYVPQTTGTSCGIVFRKVLGAVVLDRSYFGVLGAFLFFGGGLESTAPKLFQCTVRD